LSQVNDVVEGESGFKDDQACGASGKQIAVGKAIMPSASG
jgi:hypothetical protein